MQRLYWRQAKISWRIYAIISVLSITGYTTVELFQQRIVQPYYKEKIKASRRMKYAMELIREYRLSSKLPVDLEVDPTNSGMLGLSSSPTTSNAGNLQAKRTTVNPNWAGVVVELLRKAGVDKGETIAVGISGSFPALNLATMIAADVMDLKVISIASVGASTWGANIPTLTWLDMERILHEHKVINHRSVAASLGGAGDRAIGLAKEGRDMLRDAIIRNGVRPIEAKNDEESIERRMEIYREFAEGESFAAYVNVGGAIVSTGPKSVKYGYHAGLNTRLPPEAIHTDNVIKRFIDDGVPVVNLSQVAKLAEEYGFPIEPLQMPQVGEGTVFVRMQYNRWLAGGVLAAILAGLYALLKLDVGVRLGGLARGKSQTIEPMV